MKKFVLWMLVALITFGGVWAVPGASAAGASSYSGWKTGSTGYRYYFIKGVKQTGWEKIGSYWYYFNTKGVMKTGWLTWKGNRYYLNSVGKMYRGFRLVGSRYYYFEDSGARYGGWRRVNNKFRYFSRSTGIMAKSTSVGGRKINAQGIWIPVVVLDPGHSGKVASGTEPLGPGSSLGKAKDTSGTQGVSTGVEEYKLTLDIGKKLKTELERRGCRVIMTRSDSAKAMSCKERAAVANNARANAYIRIHANGSSSSAANGAMTICTTRNSPFVANLYTQNRKLSQCVLDSYIDATRAKKEFVWETDSMSGNNWSKVPTTIIEMGYMSNPWEDRQMQQSSYQKKMVLGIANGVENFFR